MIEILKWSDSFESADTRKRQRLGWFLCPSGCDSKGFRKLMRDGKDGMVALGFFQALCQAMATMSISTRQSGVFKNSDDTLMDLDDILELARVGGMKPADYRQITGRLVACGWIRVHNSLNFQQYADYLPPICHSSPSFVQGEGEGEGQEQGEGKAPPNPQGGFTLSHSESKKPDPDQLAVGKLLGRRESTKWTSEELKLLKAIKPIHPDDLELMQRFYSATIPKQDDFRRTSLERLLKHWNGELDKARIFNATNK